MPSSSGREVSGLVGVFSARTPVSRVTIPEETRPWLLELLVNPHSVVLRKQATLILHHATPKRSVTPLPKQVRANEGSFAVLDALFGVLDSTIRAPQTGDSLQVLGTIRLLASSEHSAAFLQVRGAVPFLCDNLRAEAHRLRNAEQELLREPFKLAVVNSVDSVLPRWFAEVLQCIVTASPRSRHLFIEQYLDKTLEAIVIMKDIMLSHSPHIDSAISIMQQLVVQGGSASSSADSEARKRQFLVAGMRVLDQAWASSSSPVSDSTAGFLVGQMNEVIKPPKRRPDFRIQLRRAPTQEDFFRGALPKNPIRYSDLVSASPEAGAAVTMDLDGTGGNEDTGPRMSDVRRRIAKDLDMQDAEELLELLVCN